MSNTPKLRFKEFSGEWESKKLGDVALLIKDGTHGTHKDVEEGPYLLSAKNIKDGKIIVTNDDRKISYEDYNSIYKNYSLKENDILLSIVGTIGRVAVMPYMEDIAFQRSVAILRFDLNSQYIYQYMNTNIFQNQLLRNQVVSAQPGIYLNDIKKLDINIPSNKEQEKIASFLSLVDKKISLQGEKVEMLKEYKKGMMQKIFIRELRFKDDCGRDYPKWEEKKLGSIIKIKSNRNKNKEIDLVLSVSNTKGFIRQSDQFEDREVASSDTSNYKIVKKGDFAFNPARINVGSIARLKLYDEGIISPMYICFKALELLDEDYLEYFLMTNSFDKQMKNKLEGSVRQTLSADALGQIIIKLPSLDEQKKIGEFLNKIDSKVKKEQEKLDSLNKYKKGLLQQMFV